MLKLHRVLNSTYGGKTHIYYSIFLLLTSHRRCSSSTSSTSSTSKLSLVAINISSRTCTIYRSLIKLDKASVIGSEIHTIAPPT